MSDISNLSKQLMQDFPYTFIEGEDFKWSPHNNAIVHPPLSSLQHIWSLLHEIAHAELHHTTFDLDIHLIGLETTAWQWAVEHLAPLYNILIDNDYIQDHLDTYRLWLHQRSVCPRCGQNGLQTQTKIYSCLNCKFLWRANEARLCSLRRTKLGQQS